MKRPLRLLSVSNGHGEDDIACKILARLRPLMPSLEIDAWPMMGHGTAYRAAGWTVVGPQTHLPSEGFGTNSARLFLRDLAGGFVRSYWRQFIHARTLRGRYDMMLGTGDVVPLAVARVSRTAMAFVDCAKSAYYGPPDGHTVLERHLMRRCCVDVFPRDLRTAEAYARTGVPCTYLGNPMMDGLGDPAAVWPHDPDEAIVLMLPGSRGDAIKNGRLLLGAAALFAEQYAGRARFLFALHPSTDPSSLADAPGWRRDGSGGDVLRLGHDAGALAELAPGQLGPMARAASLAVGLAGTANEQAIGLGLPLITLPGAGGQGAAYVKMKMAYFAEAAIEVGRDPSQVATAVADLLSDPQRRARMAAAGRERMGQPGASAAIAACIAERLSCIGAPS